MKSTNWTLSRRLQSPRFASFPMQNLQVLSYESRNLKGLSRRQDHFALLPFASGDYHEIIYGGSVAQDARVFVSAQAVTGPMLQQM